MNSEMKKELHKNICLRTRFCKEYCLIRIHCLDVWLLVIVARFQITFHKRYKPFSYLIAHYRMMQNAGNQQAKGSLLQKWKCDDSSQKQFLAVGRCLFFTVYISMINHLCS